MKQISRDPFARTTLVRDHIPGYLLIRKQTCDWCGNLNGFGGLFRYATDPDDGGRLHWHDGEFCSLSCHNSYHS